MREKIDTKNFTISGGALYDVELVNLMSQALSENNQYIYRVRVISSGWNDDYKQHWANSIKNINHWRNLNFDYDSANDEFVFMKR